MKNKDTCVHNLRLDFHMTQRTLAPVRFSDGLTGKQWHRSRRPKRQCNFRPSALLLNPTEMQRKDFAMTHVQPECAGQSASAASWEIFRMPLLLPQLRVLSKDSRILLQKS